MIESSALSKGQPVANLIIDHIGDEHPAGISQSLDPRGNIALVVLSKHGDGAATLRIASTLRHTQPAASAGSWLQRPSTKLRQRITASDSPLPKALDAAILASQTGGTRGMSAKTADLRRR
jgi:hypothetical protein